MQNAVIIHGKPSKEEYYNPDSPAQSNKHWIPWIQRQLVLQDIIAQAIEMPHPYRPVYEDWKRTFEQMSVTTDTVLIGHSCGAGFLLRWLSENDAKPKQVVLVAPWLDPKGELDTGMFDFTIDSELTARIPDLHVIYSTDDFDAIQMSVQLLQDRLPDAVYHTFTDKKHFCFKDLGTEKFPELFDIVKVDTQ